MRGDGPATIAKRKGVVQAMPRTKLVKRKADCLYAQFTRLLMKFIDDLAFWYDPEAKAMQVRAAACVGKSDLGANRQRVEAVRKALAGMN